MHQLIVASLRCASPGRDPKVTLGDACINPGLQPSVVTDVLEEKDHDRPVVEPTMDESKLRLGLFHAERVEGRDEQAAASGLGRYDGRSARAQSRHYAPGRRRVIRR